MMYYKAKINQTVSALNKIMLGLLISNAYGYCTTDFCGIGESSDSSTRTSTTIPITSASESTSQHDIIGSSTDNALTQAPTTPDNINIRLVGDGADAQILLNPNHRIRNEYNPRLLGINEVAEAEAEEVPAPPPSLAHLPIPFLGPNILGSFINSITPSNEDNNEVANNLQNRQNREISPSVFNERLMDLYRPSIEH